MWTKWEGIPLQAWTTRFFNLGCSKFGEVVKIHDVTENKLCLDAAFIKVQIGMEAIGSGFYCMVNGKLFVIRIEEVNCSDEELDMKIYSYCRPSSQSDFSEGDSWSDGDSADALLVL